MNDPTAGGADSAATPPPSIPAEGRQQLISALESAITQRSDSEPELITPADLAAAGEPELLTPESVAALAGDPASAPAGEALSPGEPGRKRRRRRRRGGRGRGRDQAESADAAPEAAGDDDGAEDDDAEPDAGSQAAAVVETTLIRRQPPAAPTADADAAAADQRASRPAEPPKGLPSRSVPPADLAQAAAQFAAAPRSERPPRPPREASPAAPGEPRPSVPATQPVGERAAQPSTPREPRAQNGAPRPPRPRVDQPGRGVPSVLDRLCAFSRGILELCDPSTPSWAQPRLAELLAESGVVPTPCTGIPHPDFHEVVGESSEAAVPAGHIAVVVAPGFSLRGDRGDLFSLRRAQVKIAPGQAAPAPAATPAAAAAPAPAEAAAAGQPAAEPAAVEPPAAPAPSAPAPAPAAAEPPAKPVSVGITLASLRAGPVRPPTPVPAPAPIAEDSGPAPQPAADAAAPTQPTAESAPIPAAAPAEGADPKAAPSAPTTGDARPRPHQRRRSADAAGLIHHPPQAAPGRDPQRPHPREDASEAPRLPLAMQTSEDLAARPKSEAFRALGLNDQLLADLAAIGYQQPTPIQEEAIPHVLAGRDMIGQAQTGTGKTAAFGLPALQSLYACPAQEGDQKPVVLVLCPTRELAKQVHSEITRFAGASGARAALIYGGVDMDQQYRQLQRHPHIVVGTPGRIIDHMKRRTLDLSRLRLGILDEADQMLDIGFWPDVNWIISHTPPDRQLLMFSATMPAPVQELADKHMREPVHVRIAPKQVTVEQVDQKYIAVPHDRKNQLLAHFIETYGPPQLVVFCKTKHQTDRVAEVLKRKHMSAGAIHGDLPQSKRERTLADFRSGALQCLVATNVAARGLDIPSVSHVVNYDVPEAPEEYVHRIGRTARNGARGVARTFITPEDGQFLLEIEKHIGLLLEEEIVPGFEPPPPPEIKRTIAEAPVGGTPKLLKPLIKGIRLGRLRR